MPHTKPINIDVTDPHITQVTPMANQCSNNSNRFAGIFLSISLIKSHGGLFCQRLWIGLLQLCSPWYQTTRNNLLQIAIHIFHWHSQDSFKILNPNLLLIITTFRERTIAIKYTMFKIFYITRLIDTPRKSSAVKVGHWAPDKSPLMVT